MTEPTPNAAASEAGPQIEGYITKEELARRIKKTIRTVEHWQRRGILPYVKVGQSVLFKWTVVEAHLERHFGVCRNKPSR